MTAIDTMTTSRRRDRRAAEASSTGTAPATPAAVEVRSLTKVWPGGRVAVDELSFSVAAGRVVGFIGPNGSGKTTTLRMLLGLVRPTSGEATVLGEPITHPERYLHRVGSLVETPALYLNMSGAANLKVLARLGDHDDSRIPELIDIVGVDADLRAKVGTYSLGNRQRLAIAAALLGDPDLLLLDEPANGLDPLGTRDLRRFLKNLTGAGKTVFLSSHLLGELELVCDDLVMIQDGRLMYDGPLEDLVGGSSRLVAVAEDTDDHDDVLAICDELGHHAVAHSGKIWVEAPAAFAGELNRLCMDAGVTLVELGQRRKDLEALFIEMADHQRNTRRKEKGPVR